MSSIPTFTELQMSEECTLRAITKTWSRDSHGLFDYEATNTKNHLIFANPRQKLVRKKNDVRAALETTELELEERDLCWVKLVDNVFFLSNPLTFGMLPTEEMINDLQNKIWYVLKPEDSSNSTLSNSDVYNVKINDIVKLGRVKYVITEIKMNDKLESLDKDVEKPVFNLISEYKKTFAANPDLICKICLSHSEEESNPMINLCKCSGSISWVHFFCLKSWMQTKLSVKENEKKTVTLYSMKSFNCEICKTPYPCKILLTLVRIRSEQNCFDIIDYSRPQDKNYIILESLNQVKDNNNQKSIQVITLEEGEKILMGRGHETDVRINDISVSRTHAQLTFSDNKIFIKDLKSKFGTLVLVQNDIRVGEKSVALQIGRTYGEYSVITQKECLRLRKEMFKCEDKTGMNFKQPGKLLFRKHFLILEVEKPQVKDTSRARLSNLNSMDVDNISGGQTNHVNNFSLTLNRGFNNEEGEK